MAKKYKLPYYPTRVFKDSNGLIIAILLENNRIIQVVPEKTSVDLIEASGKYYVDVNKYISNAKEKTNERVLMSHTLIYQNETYELLRMEIANFLQSNKEKDEIIKIIQNQQMKNRRDLLKRIIN
jgi:hypothetical protein